METEVRLFDQLNICGRTTFLATSSPVSFKEYLSILYIPTIVHLSASEKMKYVCFIRIHIQK